MINNYSHTVTLTSSADLLCPGDTCTVVFTCVTDTGRLVWEINDSNNRHSFHSPAQINMSHTVKNFKLTLLSVKNNSIYQSTAVAHNISVYYNGTNISCDNGPVSNPKKLSVIISKMLDYNFTAVCFVIQIYLLHHLHPSTWLLLF